MDLTNIDLSAVVSAGSQRTFAPLGPTPKVLMVWPQFPSSFWGMHHLHGIVPERAAIPPLGLITVAALCPQRWQIRLVDRAFEELRDEDLLWADIVMVSGMSVQRADLLATLRRARSLERRTFVGGPWASSEPELLIPEADHVLVGEADEVFADIAAALENGTARSLYHVAEKPSMEKSPVPRFDLLKLDSYSTMPVQFSRGCPFECEFCDIITIYGRRPRAKTPAQLLTEITELHRLGWEKWVFIVDDNFIGNQKKALAATQELAAWQRANRYPFAFFTEASIDLADKAEMLAAMVEANFVHIFIGVETPSASALKETRKFQNLRKDTLSQIQAIQRSGLWISGGFIVGFDADDETIFERQREFLEKAAIPWAMVGLLQAPPTTPLFERLRREGRLREDVVFVSNFGLPNFEPKMGLPVLLRGFSALLSDTYAPESYCKRLLASMEAWHTQPVQQPPRAHVGLLLRIMALSVWVQGVRSDYRRTYWTTLGRLLYRCRKQPVKLWLGLLGLVTGHHFITYTRELVGELEQQLALLPVEVERAAAASV